MSDNSDINRINPFNKVKDAIVKEERQYIGDAIVKADPEEYHEEASNAYTGYNTYSDYSQDSINSQFQGNSEYTYSQQTVSNRQISNITGSVSPQNAVLSEVSVPDSNLPSQQGNDPNVTQSQNTSLPQTPTVQPVTSNVPVTMEQGQFLQLLLRSSQKHENTQKHQYVPMVLDNAMGCVTWVVKFSVDAAQRLNVDNYSKLSEEIRKSSKHSTIDIGRLYIHSAESCGDTISLDIEYINANEARQTKRVFVEKELCQKNKLYDALVAQDINCFNDDLPHSKISQYLYKLILSKLKNGSSFPETNGFCSYNNRYCFVSKEFCRKEQIPDVTEKSFSFDSEISSIEMAENFAVITLQHTSPQIFLLLNMIRILGLLTTPLDRCGIRFGKVIFLSGKAEKLSKYLQIYDRGIMYQRALPINISPKILAVHLMSGKDTVVMLQDNESDSAYRKGNGAGVVELLSSMTFDNMKNLELSYPFITAVFSDRLSQLMDSSRSLVIDASDLSSDLDDNSIISACYELDKCIVKRICSDIDDFEKCVSKNAEKYQKLIETNSDISDESKKCIVYLMVVYHEISRIVKQLNGKFDEKAMIDFLVGVLENSEKIYNGGEVTDEFKMKLNQMISKGEIELVENSSMNNCFGATGKNPIVFIDDDWLYMVKETFDAIMKKIKLASTAVAVKEALNDKGLLKVSENLQYKATLYHSRYSGKINVTAVSADILSNANLKRNLGGMFNYHPCENDGKIDRILLGRDEKGRSIYWSIGHKDLTNKHLVINGRSGTGKSTAANLIVKELFDKGHNVAYVDFSSSDTDEKLIANGFTEDFLSENISRIKIADVLDGTYNIEEIIQEIQEEHRIIIFEADKYSSDEVEPFLTLLYDGIVENKTFSIFLVIDEMHRKDYALYNIMETGRGNGISLISIFQGPHEMKPKQLSMLNQSEVKLIFKMSDNEDSKSIAESNNLKPTGKFIERISNLLKRRCIVTGNLEDSSGELQNNRFVEVTIPDINIEK